MVFFGGGEEVLSFYGLIFFFVAKRFSVGNAEHLFLRGMRYL